MGARLDPLLAPRAVAIIGASDRNHHGKQGADALIRMKYPGPVYYINATRKEAWGKPCYPDLKSTPTVADLAILVVNRSRVLEAIHQCADAGVKALVINTDGFGESADTEGRGLQQQVVALVKEKGLLLCGPNCLGVLNFHAPAAAYCGPIREPVGPGNLSFISQSGGNSALFIELAWSRNLGLSYLFSTGNEAALDTCDYFEHVIEDPNTTVICMMLEAIRDPKRFLSLAVRATQLGKPVIAVKLGRSEAARLAAVAHTGALAGSDDAVNALFEQAGVIRARTLDEAIDQCALFCLVPQSRWMRGPRIGVFTVGGGLAGLVSDLAQDNDIEVPALPAEIKQSVAHYLATNVNIQNPFDVPGPYVNEKPELVHDYIRQCAASSEFDAVVMLRAVSGTKSLQYLDGIETVPEQFGKPVFVSASIDSPMEDYKREFMAHTNLTFASGLSRLVTGIAAMVRFAHLRKTAADPQARPRRALSQRAVAEFERHKAAGRKVLSHSATYALIDEFGLTTVPQREVHSLQAAREAASALGFPLVAKLVNSESVTHKTELGAIVVGIKNQDELGAAVEKLLGIINAQDLREDGQAIPVLIQKMVQPAVEMFLGATVPVGDFPPMVLVGAGGIFVELMRDVSRVLAPTDQASALLAIERLKTYPLLTGYRGARKFDVQAVAQSLVKLGELIAATEEYVIDIDLNPLLVLPEGEGALIVDAVLALRTAGH